MQIRIKPTEFNTLITLYISEIVNKGFDYKKSLEDTINKNPTAKLLNEERKERVIKRDWKPSDEKEFNDQLKKLIPSLDINALKDFDSFLKQIKNLNMNTWLLNNTVKQNSNIRLDCKRMVNKLSNNDVKEIIIML